MDGMKIGRGVWTVAALTLVTSFAVVRAQQPPAQQPPAPAQPPAAAPAAPVKPLLPVAVSTFVAHPENYYGQTVTVTGPVEQIVSALSFSLDADAKKSTGEEILILAPRLDGPVKANAYITVIGKAVQFNAAEISKTAADRKIDVPADAAAKFNGKPAVLATQIVTSDYVELTRKLPPPMTADDQMLSAIMKKVQPAIGAVRQAADRSDMAAVRQNALVLKQSFTEVEAYFKKQGKPDAMKMAGDARLGAESLERVVATGKWDEVKTAAGALQQTCGACHSAYRERFDDGSYRMKVASK